MANEDSPLFLSINRADEGTVHGNSAAGLPATNLQTRQITRKWRSPNAAAANTWFSCAFPTDRIVDAAALIAHNMGQAGEWRVRLFDGAYREWNLLGPDLPADMTLTREHPAWVFGADGFWHEVGANAPRFEYDPDTLKPLGFLRERDSTNLVLRSNAFDHAYWVKNLVAVDPTPVAGPDGAASAWLMAESAAAGEHWIESGAIATVANQFHTASVFVQPLARVFVRLHLLNTAGTAGATATFDLGLNQVVGTTLIGDTDAAKARIKRYRDGWYRISLRTRHAGTATKMRIQVLNDGGTAAFVGDPLKGLRLWHAQCEQRLRESSPITTTDAPVNRPADAVAVTPIAAYWNAAGGALYVEAIHPAPDDAEVNTLVSLSDGTADEKIEVALSETGEVFANIVDNATNQAGLTIAGAVAADKPFRVAVGFGINNFAALRDGGAPVTDLSGTVPTPTRLDLGDFDGHLRFVKYWGERPDVAALQTITASTYDLANALDPTAKYDSGILSAWPVKGGFGVLPWGQFQWGNALPPEEAAEYTISSFHVMPGQQIARHVFINCYDPTNEDGYVEAGRFLIGPAWRPSFGMLYGWEIWWEDTSQVDESLGGQEYADERPRYRVVRFSLEMIDDLEMLENAFDFIDRRKGITGDLLVIPRPNQPELFIHEAIYGRCRQLHPVGHPSAAGRSKTFEIKEFL